jgi:hypothetical protein
MVAAVDMRREARLVLAAQDVGDDRRQPADNKAVGINEMPLLSTSAGLADLVVFISAFMAFCLLLECERRHPNGSAGERANCG